MKKRAIILILIALSVMSLSAGNFTVQVDENRYLVNGNQTRLEINYAVPYQSLEFISAESRYQAELFVDIAIKYGDKLIKNESFTNGIIVNELQKLYSDTKFMDKIDITLAAYQLDIELTFTDVHTESSYTWNYQLEPLTIDALSSDMELSTSIIADSSNYMEKFHRDGKLYNVQPDHTFIIDQNEFYFYQEFYNLFEDENGNYKVDMEMSFTKDDIVSEVKKLHFENNWQSVVAVTGKIDISNFSEGYYDVNTTITDLVTGVNESKRDHIFLKEKSDHAKLHRLFPDLEDDFTLGSYFFNANQKKVWKTLSLDGKENFLAKFWQAQDTNPATEENEFMNELKERINYANKYFTHFKKGWTTDMGRIYIRNGAPYEISKHKTNNDDNLFSDETSEESEGSDLVTTYSGSRYTSKDYQIWKYRLNKNLNYIFIDLNLNGQFKLIYSSDDESETTLSNWRSYLGNDFEDGLLY